MFIPAITQIKSVKERLALNFGRSISNFEKKTEWIRIVPPHLTNSNIIFASVPFYMKLSFSHVLKHNIDFQLPIRGVV